MKKNIIISVATILFLSGMMMTAFAHQPAIEAGTVIVNSGEELKLSKSFLLKDPLVSSVAAYGGLFEPQEVDLYKFTAGKDGVIPIEVLVPVRFSNRNFRPAYAVIGEALESDEKEKLPFSIGERLKARIIYYPTGERQKFFEAFSSELIYKGAEVEINLKKGSDYYIAVFDPGYNTGDYVLGLGTAEDFSDVSLREVIGKVIKIKFAIVGGKQVPWADIFGFFIFIAGFVVGLGAVTVIDVLGFISRKSEYWTEVTIKAHKVTKPLIWLGILLSTAGALVVYREGGVSNTGLFHLIVFIALVVNGFFLSFSVSPYLIGRESQGKLRELLPVSWQKKIFFSFLVSFLGWWSSLFLLVWHIFIAR